MIRQLLGLCGGWPSPVTDDAEGYFPGPRSPAPLPWRVGGPCEEGVIIERDVGMIYDANGRHIATVDEWAALPDDEAEAIATMIVGAVNACGGFRVELQPKGQENE